MKAKLKFYLALLWIMFFSTAHSQEYSEGITDSYRVAPNLTYVSSGSWDGKLDIYYRLNSSEPSPTVIFLHGGNPYNGSKDAFGIFSLLPYLEKGWNAINLEHRQPGLTLAEDAYLNTLCAIRWVHDNAATYGIDREKLVISGSSSGGWFAVAAALTIKPENWDAACPGDTDTNVAAVVNWFGNWDLADVLEGPNSKPYAPMWVRGSNRPLELAKLLSPLPLSGRVIPPVISIHGDADPVVPYSQSVRLHEALREAEVPEHLVTIPDGLHGRFPRSENKRAFDNIWAFLSSVGIE